MVIKKLNKFFHDHSRVIFGIFAILIILAFTEIPMGGAGCDDPADTVVGTVYGENVTAGELQQLHRDFTLYNTLLNNPVSNIDFQTLLELKAWLKRFTLLKKVQRQLRTVRFSLMENFHRQNMMIS